MEIFFPEMGKLLDNLIVTAPTFQIGSFLFSSQIATNSPSCNLQCSYTSLPITSCLQYFPLTCQASCPSPPGTADPASPPSDVRCFPAKPPLRIAPLLLQQATQRRRWPAAMLEAFKALPPPLPQSRGLDGDLHPPTAVRSGRRRRTPRATRFRQPSLAFHYVTNHKCGLENNTLHLKSALKKTSHRWPHRESCTTQSRPDM